MNTLDTGRGYSLAYHYHKGTSSRPGVIFLGGFRSDMEGTKALYLEEYCKSQDQDYIRFDYFAHGATPGDFKDGTVSLWLDDVLTVLDQLADQSKKHILIGSSMGGWLMMLAALKRPERIQALIGIAAAPDFTQSLMYEQMTEAQKTALSTDGFILEPNDYSDEPYIITQKLIEDGRTHLLLSDPIDIHCPVHLLHGTQDTAVPIHWPETINQRLINKQAEITLIDGGDHSLSQPENLEALKHAIERFI